MKIATLIIPTILFLTPLLSFAKTVRYELRIRNQEVNITGKPVNFAITVNGTIPAPTLEFTEGDDAEILVINEVPDEEVSLHWHGILLPPEEDGVAYINTPPILPGTSRTFRFKIRQHGTYWYHSHTMVQEQKGAYGAFIIHPKKPTIKYDKDLVVVLSDWSDEDADQIIKNLRKDGDYYLYKKNSIRSIGGAIQAGQAKTYFKNEWERMGGMDLSDVGYDSFLINGKQSSQILDAKAGEKIRLRIINAGASSYFYVSLADQIMNVISADGLDIEPIKTKELIMGMAETYDVLFTVPENKNYELRATVQDVTGFASGWIGNGSEKISAAAKPSPDLYAPMDHSGMDHSSMGGMDHSKMDHSKMDHGKPTTPETNTLETLTVDDLKALSSTVLPKEAKVQDLKLVLGGDMERYVWHINGKAIHQDRDILINEGDVIRFTFVNETMMHHPMHLHGHFFRVINKNGDRSPLKHTVDVPPMGTRTIEFYANERGQWMLHCHNLYHMKTGMARVVKYMSYKPSPEMAMHEKHDPHMHDHLYKKASLQAATNHAEGRLKFSQTWGELEGKVESRKDEDWEAEGDLFYRRWFGNFNNLIVGATAAHDDTRGVLGFGHLLPMLIETDVLIDHKGKLRVDLEKRFQWTQTLFTEAEYTWRQDVNLESDYVLSLMYAKSWNWSAGIKYTGHSWGAGFNLQF